MTQAVALIRRRARQLVKAADAAAGGKPELAIENSLGCVLHAATQHYGGIEGQQLTMAVGLFLNGLYQQIPPGDREAFQSVIEAALTQSDLDDRQGGFSISEVRKH